MKKRDLALRVLWWLLAVCGGVGLTFLLRSVGVTGLLLGLAPTVGFCIVYATYAAIVE